MPVSRNRRPKKTKQKAKAQMKGWAMVKSFANNKQMRYQGREPLAEFEAMMSDSAYTD